MSTGALPADLVRLGEASTKTGVPVRTIREWASRGPVRGGIAKYRQQGFYVLVSLAEVKARAKIERVK